MSDRLLHTKVSKRKPLTHFPKKEDGYDGDMQIVSIKGKGTYLCIKDKSEWKISEKFNPRNKFDTHIFDEITTRKIRGKGGLTASLESKSITTTTQDDGTGISTSSTSVPVFKIGNGTNAGFLTSKGDTSLVLSAGSTTTEMFNNGSISSTLTSTGSYFFLFNTDNTSTGGRVRIYNGNISGDASLNIETKGPNQDVYTRYYHNNSEPASNKSWSIGMDGTDDMLKINYLAGATLASPSSSGNLLTIDETNGTVTAGGFTTTGTWTFDEYTSGTIGITTVQDSGTTFNDNDTSLMTAAAIADKIEAYGYSTTTGDITGVTAGDGLSGGGASGAVTLAVSVDDSTIEINSDTLRVKDDGITYAKIQNVTATDRILGRDSSGAGVIEEITPANLRTMINVADGATAVTNHVTNDADDTMAGTLTIDKDLNSTSATSTFGLVVDVDRIGDVSSGTDITTGLNLDVNSTGASGGIISSIGIDLDVVGDSGGTSIATGMQINVDSADSNTGVLIQTSGTHIRLQHATDPTNDYVTFTAADTGDLTIATFGDGATDSNITLDADGDIELNADGGQVRIKDDIAQHFLFDCDNTKFTIYDDDNALDYFNIVVAANGATTIATADGTGVLGHLTISPDGDLSLNSNGEYFLKPSSGGIKIKETDDKVSETAGYGQLWVKDDAPNNLYFTDDADNDIQLTSDLQPLGQVLVATTTISQAEMDDLHSTEKVLVAAQGSNKVIIPIKIVLFVDRDASTAQSANVHMYFSATAATTTGNVWGLFKSFMRMESGDRVMSWADTISDNIQSLTGGDNTALSVKMSGAITSGSIDSVKVVTTYYVFDNS